MAGDLQYAVTPYVLWFDESGTFISQVSLRAPSPLTNVYPNSLYFESFAQPSGWAATLTGTAPDIGVPGVNWTSQVSNFVASAFGNGTAVPATANTRTIQTIAYGSANAFAGVTLTTLANASYSSGLVLRWASNTSYIRVDQGAIIQNNGGTFSILASHSTAFAAGDRMTASCNGNVITVYRNGVQVSKVTTAFNNAATVFGMIVESSGVTGVLLTDGGTATDQFSRPALPGIIQDPVWPVVRPPLTAAQTASPAGQIIGGVVTQ